MKARGVYFLANDKVFDLAVAFLESFRNKNAEIELCLIPYDENFQQIAQLSARYNFSIFDNQTVLSLCDEISVRFHSAPLGAYRKLATWQGEFREFAYIDIDTIVLENIDFVFQYLKHAQIFTSHSDIPSILKWVWKDSIFKRNALTRRQIRFAANTGFFVSTNDLFPIESVYKKLADALKLKRDMELFCMEQPFLNYLIVTSGHSYSSLSKMADDNVSNDILFECWAGMEGGIVVDGQFHIPGRPKYFLVHWAGIWQSSLEKIPYKELWLYYRNLNKDLKPISYAKSDKDVETAN
jgi:hypothetical protein